MIRNAFRSLRQDEPTDILAVTDDIPSIIAPVIRLGVENVGHAACEDDLRAASSSSIGIHLVRSFPCFRQSENIEIVSIMSSDRFGKTSFAFRADVITALPEIHRPVRPTNLRVLHADTSVSIVSTSVFFRPMRSSLGTDGVTVNGDVIPSDAYTSSPTAILRTSSLRFGVISEREDRIASRTL